jgi:branched-chain amino acid transport system permease protein
MVIVGGMGSLWGSLLGAGVLTCISEALHIAKQYHIIAYGVFLCLVLVFLPEGILIGIYNLFLKAKTQKHIMKADRQ